MSIKQLLDPESKNNEWCQLYSHSLSTNNIVTDNIQTNSLDTSTFNSTNFNADIINAQSIITDSLQTNNFTTSNFNVTDLDTTNINTDVLNSNFIVTNTLETTTFSTNNLDTTTINTDVLNANFIVTNTLETTTFNATNLETNIINTDILNANYIFENIGTASSGEILLSTSMVVSTIPTSTGGTFATFNRALNRLSLSGILGTSKSCYTDNGITWLKPAFAPINMAMEFSPELNIYACVSSESSNCFTSTTGINSFQAGTPIDEIFSGFIKWIPELSLFIANTGGTSRAVTSINGVNYTATNLIKECRSISYSPILGIYICVGIDGASYSYNCVDWFYSLNTASLSASCWSNSMKKFYATPRGGVISTIYTSVDGIVWVEHLNKLDVAVRSIIYIDSLKVFVCVGDVGDFLISKDGLNYRETWINNGTFTGDLYGSIYVEEWGFFIAFGISTSVVNTIRRFK